MSLEVAECRGRARRVYKEYTADGPIVFLPMNDPALPLIDPTGSGFSAAITGSNIKTRVAGPFGIGSSTRGDPNASGYLTVAANASLNIVGDVTVSCWMKPLTKFVEGLVGIRNNATNQAPYILGYGPSSVTWGFGTGTGIANSTVAWAPVVGQWYHIVGTRASNILKTYINGVASAPTDLSANTPTAASGTPLYLFSCGTGLNDVFDGDLAFVSIYAKDIGAARVLAQYQAVYEKLAWLLKNPK